LFLASFSVALITGSCSIEKRIHNAGYHITWNKIKNQADGEKSETTRIKLKERKNKNFMNLENESIATNEEIKGNFDQVKFEGNQVKGNEKNTFKSKIDFSSKIELSEKAMQNTHSFSENFTKSTFKKSVLLKKELKNSQGKKSDDGLILLYILAVILPFLAVGIVTDWDLKLVLISVLLMCLFWLPAVIFAIFIVSENN
jgi:uncharacterized membrane protein YqaE (UPF0057 family)